VTGKFKLGDPMNVAALSWAFIDSVSSHKLVYAWIETHFTALELHSAMPIAWIVAGLVTKCNSWHTLILSTRVKSRIAIRVSESSRPAVVICYNPDTVGLSNLSLLVTVLLGHFVLRSSMFFIKDGSTLCLYLSQQVHSCPTVITVWLICNLIVLSKCTACQPSLNIYELKKKSLLSIAECTY